MNLEKEVRNGYTVSAEKKKVWAIELEITRHILDVCKRHGLSIWADWGTLLGAIREKGFIPWDDDIDLMMMRQDYEQLLQLADSEFNHPFFLQSVHSDKQYYRGNAQVRYDGTAAILPDDLHQPFHQGIFVDIFVYDNIPDKKGHKWKRSLNKAKCAQKCLQTAYYRRFNLKDFVTSAKFVLARIACFLLGPKHIYRFFEKQFTKWNRTDCRCVSCPTYDYKQIERETKEKSWYENTLMFPFEDIDIPIPEGYHNVLTTLYGQDYMKPCNAPSGHGDIIFNTERSYQDVLKELKKEENR